MLKSLQMCCSVFPIQTTSASRQELKAEKEGGENSDVEKADSPI